MRGARDRLNRSLPSWRAAVAGREVYSGGLPLAGLLLPRAGCHGRGMETTPGREEELTLPSRVGVWLDEKFIDNLET